MSKKETKKSWTEKRKEIGLCLQCGKKSGPKSKLYCSDCSEKFNNNSKKRVEILREKGLCVSCQEPVDRIDKHHRLAARCNKCVDKYKKTKNNKKEEWKKLNLCIKCGNVNPLPGVRIAGFGLNEIKCRRCEICILKHAARSHLGASHRWEELKILFEKQKKICPYSGRKIFIGLDAELDHIIPKSKGGSNELSNLQWVYCDINKMKLHHMPEYFIDLVKEIYQYRCQ